MSTRAKFQSILGPRWVVRGTEQGATQFVPAPSPEAGVPAPLTVMALDHDGNDTSLTDGVVMFEVWETRPPS